MIKIDNALIFSELESDFAYGQEAECASLFLYFPDALTTSISEAGRNKIGEIFAKQDEISKFLRRYRKTGNVEKAVDNFTKRISTLKSLCETKPDVTLGELYSSMGTREQIVQTAEPELGKQRPKHEAAWLKKLHEKKAMEKKATEGQSMETYAKQPHNPNANTT